MKVLAVAIIIVALVIIIVPQFTNCDANKESKAMDEMSSAVSTAGVSYASVEEILRRWRARRRWRSQSR